MHIHWFPGHMTKSLRLIEENLKTVDAIVYVLDARAPLSCINESFDKLIDGKSILYVLNKIDLADKQKVSAWQNYFAKQGKNVIAVTSTEKLSSSVFINALKKIEKPKVSKFEAKGVFIPTRLMVLGVPNSGKSTLINSVCGKKSAITGNKPGVTRGKQWVRLSNGMELLDTPGTLFPDFKDQQKAQRLAFIGSIRDEVVDQEELARELALCMMQLYPKEFMQKYSLTQTEDAEEIMRQICKKRGFLLRGGDFDMERCSKGLVDDFRKGKICPVTLEMPDEGTN